MNSILDIDLSSNRAIEANDQPSVSIISEECDFTVLCSGGHSDLASSGDSFFLKESSCTTATDCIQQDNRDRKEIDGSHSSGSSARPDDGDEPPSIGDTLMHPCRTVENETMLQFASAVLVDSVVKDTDTFEEAMEKYETMLYPLGFDDPNAADIYLKKGYLYRDHGRYDEAIEMLEKGRDMKLAAQQVNPSSVVEAFDNIANVQLFQGELDEAIKTQRSALEFQVKSVGHYDAAAADAYEKMGNFLNPFEHREVEAFEMYETALEIRLRVCAHDHEVVAHTYEQMTRALESLKKKDDDAIKALRCKARELRLKVTGEDNAEAAEAYEKIAQSFLSDGSQKEAIEMFTKALEVRLRLFESDHVATTNAYADMADALLTVEGKEHEAAEMYKEALDVISIFFKPHEEATADAYEYIAFRLSTMNNQQHKVVELYRRVLDIRLVTVEEEDPRTARACDDLAVALEQIPGKEDEAIEMHQMAIDFHLKTSEVDTLWVTGTYQGIVNILTKQEDYYRAIEMQRKRMNFLLKYIDHDHPNMAHIYEDLADSLLLDEGNVDEALQLYREALRIQLQTVGYENPIIANAYEKFAFAFRSIAGMQEEAVGMYGKALEVRLNAAGPEHPDVAAAYNKMANALQWFQNKEEEVGHMRSKAQEVRNSQSTEGYSESKTTTRSL